MTSLASRLVAIRVALGGLATGSTPPSRKQLAELKWALVSGKTILVVAVTTHFENMCRKENVELDQGMITNSSERKGVGRFAEDS